MQAMVDEHNLFSVILNLWLRCLSPPDGLSVDYYIWSSTLVRHMFMEAFRTHQVAKYRNMLETEFGERERDMARLAYANVASVSKLDSIEGLEGLDLVILDIGLEILNFLITGPGSWENRGSSGLGGGRSEGWVVGRGRSKALKQLAPSSMCTKLTRTLFKVLFLHTKNARHRPLKSLEESVITRCFTCITTLATHPHVGTANFHIRLLQQGLFFALADCTEPLGQYTSQSPSPIAHLLTQNLRDLLVYRDVVVASATALAHIERDGVGVAERLESRDDIGVAFKGFRDLVIERSAFVAIYDHRFADGIVLSCDNVRFHHIAPSCS